MDNLIKNLEEKEKVLKELKSLMEKGDIHSLLQIFRLKIDKKPAFYLLENTIEICEKIGVYLNEHIVKEPFYCVKESYTNASAFYVYHREFGSMRATIDLKDQDVHYIRSTSKEHFMDVRNIWANKKEVEIIQKRFEQQKERIEKEWKWKKYISLPKTKKKIENIIEKHRIQWESRIDHMEKELKRSEELFQRRTNENAYEEFETGLYHVLQSLRFLGFSYEMIEEQEKKEYQFFTTSETNVSFGSHHSFSFYGRHALALDEYKETLAENSDYFKENGLNPMRISKVDMMTCIRSWREMFGEGNVSDLIEKKENEYNVIVTSPRGTMELRNDGLAIVKGKRNSLFPYVENEDVHYILFGERPVY